MNRSKSDKNNSEEYSSSIGFSLRDVFAVHPRIELSGKTSASVEGCRGVLEYSKTQIRVSLGKYSIQIKGRGLDLRCISPTSLRIEGFITAVEYIM